ncbi:UNVERIFIED_CONTAM: hypothetical protein FKN15_056485 [Acipenser sinensis]
MEVKGEEVPPPLQASPVLLWEVPCSGSVKLHSDSQTTDHSAIYRLKEICTTHQSKRIKLSTCVVFSTTISVSRISEYPHPSTATLTVLAVCVDREGAGRDRLSSGGKRHMTTRNKLGIAKRAYKEAGREDDVTYATVKFAEAPSSQQQQQTDPSRTAASGSLFSPAPPPKGPRDGDRGPDRSGKGDRAAAAADRAESLGNNAVTSGSPG